MITFLLERERENANLDLYLYLNTILNFLSKKKYNPKLIVSRCRTFGFRLRLVEVEKWRGSRPVKNQNAFLKKKEKHFLIKD